MAPGFAIVTVVLTSMVRAERAGGDHARWRGDHAPWRWSRGRLAPKEPEVRPLIGGAYLPTCVGVAALARAQAQRRHGSIVRGRAPLWPPNANRPPRTTPQLAHGPGQRCHAQQPPAREGLRGGPYAETTPMWTGCNSCTETYVRVLSRTSKVVRFSFWLHSRLSRLAVEAAALAHAGGAGVASGGG